MLSVDGNATIPSIPTIPTIPGTTAADDVSIPSFSPIFHFRPQQPQTPGFFSDGVARAFVIVNYIILTGTISLVGIVLNAVNIIVFLKQGFKDTISITLLGIAVSDLGALATLLLQSVCYALWLHGVKHGVDFRHLQYVYGAWPHGAFARISSWITGLVSCERCLCVLIPLHVKRIVTPRRVLISTALIFLCMFAVLGVVLYSLRLRPVFKAHLNATVVEMTYIPNGKLYENVCLSVMSFNQISAFFFVIVCTAVLSVKLTSKSKWRRANVASDKGGEETMSGRDKKIIKMVVLISAIFIVCFAPTVSSMITMTLVTEYSATGSYRNLFVMSWSVQSTLEAISSSVNFFVYFHLSSKFSTSLQLLLGRSKPAVARSQDNKMNS